MPAYAKTEEKCQEDFGVVSQSSLEPLTIYKKWEATVIVENSIFEHVADDIHFQSWMNDWSRLYRSNAYKTDALHVPITSNEIAKRFLQNPNRLVSEYYQVACGIEESNELEARRLIEWYMPNRAEKENQMKADAARLTDMALSRAMISTGNKDQ